MAPDKHQRINVTLEYSSFLEESAKSGKKIW